MTNTLTQMENKIDAGAFFKREVADGPAWLQVLRQRAQARQGEMGFPTTDEEEWRFTNMAPLLQWPLHEAESARRVSASDVQPFRLEEEGLCLVFVDGHFREDLSALPPADASVQVGSLKAQWNRNGQELEMHLARHASCEANFFTALNTASFEDGAFVSVAGRAVLQVPVQLLYLATGENPGAVVQARNLIVAHANSSVKVIESYASLGDAAHLTNAVTELAISAGARVEHCRLQNENQHAVHVAAVQAVQARGSHWLSHSIAFGARLARNQIQTVFTDEGGEAILSGLYLARGEQLIDHHTVVDHAKPRCESHEYYFGILGERARGVFNGKILVRQDAQKTNAKQTNRNLVLSEHALINTKPQLEIFADDVKCTHGATIGQLSEEALFYLRSRGIGLAHARQMLVRAFANDPVERITMAPVRAYLEKLLTERFAGLDASPLSHGR